MAWNKYPYTDNHELNLDWFLDQFKKLLAAWDDLQAAWDAYKTDLTGQWEEVEAAWQTYKQYIDDYFTNLNVQTEINNKIDDMVTSGEFLNVISPTVVLQTTAETSRWLAEHISQETGYVLDTSLTVAGAAADAKAAGDAINLTFQPMPNNGGLTDANQAALNRIYLLVNPADVENLPENRSCLLFTIARVAAGGSLQFCMNSSGVVHFRACWDNVWRDWERISTKNYVDTLFNDAFQPMPANGGLTDADQAEINRIYLLINTANVTNLPENRSCLLFTIARTTVGKLQVVMNSSGTIYFRSFWTITWTNWERIPTKNYIDTLFNTAFQPMDANDGLTDADKAEINRIYLLINTEDVTNLPENRSCLLFTIARTTVGKLQVVMNSSGTVHVRTQWGSSWTAWVKLINNNDISQIAARTTPLILTAFDNFTCIGDSLTYSQVYTGPSSNRQAYVPYPRVLARKTGAASHILARSGASASDAWNEFNDQIISRNNNLTIIYLGTNLGLTDTIDSDCVGDNYENWSSTQTGSYGKLIAKSLSIGSRVILVKCYASTGDLTVTNDVIEQFGEKFNIPVLPEINFTNNKYHSYPDGTGSNTVHYNDFGYSAFADQLIHNISNLNDTDMINIIPN